MRFRPTISEHARPKQSGKAIATSRPRRRLPQRVSALIPEQRHALRAQLFRPDLDNDMGAIRSWRKRRNAPLLCVM